MFKSFDLSDKRKVRDALRLALQSALAAASCYLLMNLLGIPEVFLAVLSAVLVLEPSIGSTMGAARGRVLSTLVGCVIGFLCTISLPHTAGVAVSLAISMFILNGISSFKSEWRYGVVAAVAISLGAEENVIDMSVDRLTAIGIGVVVGLLSSLIAWPQTAEQRAKSHTRRALSAASKRFQIAIENTRTDELKESSQIEQEFHNSLSRAKGAVRDVKLTNTQAIKEQIENTEKLYNSILIIHRIATGTEKGITDKQAGIEKDSEATMGYACEIIEKLSASKTVEDQKVKDFKSYVTKVESHMTFTEDDNELNTKRHAFVFGMKQIEESLTMLVKSFEQED